MSRRAPDSELWRIGFGFVALALLGVAYYFGAYDWLSDNVIRPLFR